MLPKHAKNLHRTAVINCARGFNCFQEPGVEIDTIPSALALVFRGPRKGTPVRNLSGVPSGVCPDCVHVLVGSCPGDVRYFVRPEFVIL